VEVLRLLRSGICEMDVRAGWARMAKRSGRGMQVEQPLPLPLRLHGQGPGPGAAASSPAVEIRRFAYGPRIHYCSSLRDIGRGYGFEKASGDLFREHVASRRNCGDEAGCQISASMFGAWGSGDSVISKLGEL
jgi:hypothetical protein